jgi:hypothetical protein
MRFSCLYLPVSRVVLHENAIDSPPPISSSRYKDAITNTAAALATLNSTILNPWAKPGNDDQLPPPAGRILSVREDRRHITPNKKGLDRQAFFAAAQRRATHSYAASPHRSRVRHRPASAGVVQSFIDEFSRERLTSAF